MLWGGDERQREYYDVATVGAVVKATGGTVTYLRAPDAGGEETALHLREHLKETLRNHADSASETVLKVRVLNHTNPGGDWQEGRAVV